MQADLTWCKPRLSFRRRDKPVLTSPLSSSYTFPLQHCASPGIWTAAQWSGIMELVTLFWDVWFFGGCFSLYMHRHTVSSTAFKQGSWSIVKLHPLFECGMRDLSKNVVCNSIPAVQQYQGKMKRCRGTNSLPAPSAVPPPAPPLSLCSSSEFVCSPSATEENSFHLKVYLKFSSPIKHSEKTLTIKWATTIKMSALHLSKASLEEGSKRAGAVPGSQLAIFYLPVQSLPDQGLGVPFVQC